jgi:hypothetical protein
LYNKKTAQSKQLPDGRRFGESGHPGTDVMIFKIFSPKNSAKKLAFLTPNKAKLNTNLIITLVFEKKTPIFFAKMWQKSRKIVIITSTPGQQLRKKRKKKCSERFSLT